MPLNYSQPLKVFINSSACCITSVDFLETSLFFNLIFSNIVCIHMNVLWMYFKSTTLKNTVIPANVLEGNFVERRSLLWKSDTPETMQKLCLSTKFPHQEIRWNYRILRSVFWSSFYIGNTTWANFLKRSLTL